MKTLLCSLLILLGVPAFGATVKYYDDYPDNANPPGTFKLSIQTLDKTQGGIPYNYMTLDQFVDWLGVSGFTNGSGTIIVTNASFQYITNLYAYLTNIFSTNIITTNLFATFESITYSTNVTLSVSNFSYTISKGGSLISTNTSFFTTNIVNTTINTNNSFVNNEYVTNFTVVVPGGLTNLNATPKTLAWWDVNDAIGSIPNAAGVLVDDGAGGIGWSNTFSLTELDAQNAYLTNTFVFITNAPIIATDANGQLVASSYKYSTNIVGAANFVFGKAYWTNITGNFTFPALTMQDNAAMETLAVWVTNSGASTFTATINGVAGAPGHVVPAVFYCTNATVTEIDLSHFGVFWTNACVGKN